MLARGPYKGQRPASMWQWPPMARVLQLPGVSTLALHQTSFGTDYPKPTRLLLFGPHLFPEFCYLGPPQYDENGYYVGPLPRLHNQPSMRDRATTGPFKTTGTEQWPIRMCQWIAAMLLHSCSAAATTVIEGEELKTRIHWKIAIKATRSASLTDTGYKGERAPQEHAKPWQATRTSTTVGHVGDGESRFGS